MESINVKIELINAVLQYLGNKPYVEVAGLISNIQKAAEESAQAKAVGVMNQAAAQVGPQ